MTDRELLELAAKAAGFGDCDGNFIWNEPVYVGERLDQHGGLWDYTVAPLWNPLADDGDALRLAVKLHFSVSTPATHGRAFAQSQDLLKGVMANCGDETLDDADPFSATRRAIVRAAAEIGKAMP